MIKRSLSLAASFILALSALLMVPATPAHAAPEVETIVTWANGSADAGRLKYVYALHSEDHRCTLGRTLLFEYRTTPSGPWKVAAKDTSVYSPAMAIFFKPPEDMTGARVRIPAKTLSDGTKCLAPNLGSGRTAPASAPFTPAARQSQRALAGNTWVDEFDGGKALEEWVIYGVIDSSIKACRTNRDIYVEATNAPDTWFRLGRDKTPASGVYATTVGIPESVGPLRLRVLGRTLADGTKCDAVTYMPG